MSERIVSLVVDSYQGEVYKVEPWIPQRSLISHILFDVYLSECK